MTSAPPPSLTASEELMDKLLCSEIHRVYNTLTDSHWSESPYPKFNHHDAFVVTCKGCNRDTTELERALRAAKDAMLHLKHVTDTEREYMRRAVDLKKVKPPAEDLT
jgi:hypothetical protein